MVVLHVEHQNGTEIVPFPRECQEWWMMMNKCCDVLFVKLCLSILFHWNISFQVSAKLIIFFLKCCPMWYLWIFVYPFVAKTFILHFGLPSVFFTWKKLHWLCNALICAQSYYTATWLQHVSPHFPAQERNVCVCM